MYREELKKIKSIQCLVANNFYLLEEKYLMIRDLLTKIQISSSKPESKSLATKLIPIILEFGSEAAYNRITENEGARMFYKLLDQLFNLAKILFENDKKQLVPFYELYLLNAPDSSTVLLLERELEEIKRIK